MFLDNFFKIKMLMKQSVVLYLTALVCGCLCGYLELMQPASSFISDAFVKIFKCVSLPIIAVSLAVSLSQKSSDIQLDQVGKRTLFYTLMTTIFASLTACFLYVLISPSNITTMTAVKETTIKAGKYSDYVLSIIPSNIFSPFIEHNVMGALLFGIVLGIAVRCLPNKESHSMHNFLKVIQGIFLTIIGWVVKILPLALFAFISVAVFQFKGAANVESVKSLGQYLSVVVLANIVQGALVLPIFLWFKKRCPLISFKGMLPALSIAFFAKSSVGTLPITIETAEKNLGVSQEISRFVFPLCTAINMNGCAAFIFTTVIYVMQNHGIDITPITLFQWIFISTIAAIGNAGVPMGCFFLSMSLLTSMDVPIDLLWLILPFYSIIDMIETALNVWSDCCVVSVIDREFRVTPSQKEA